MSQIVNYFRYAAFSILALASICTMYAGYIWLMQKFLDASLFIVNKIGIIFGGLVLMLIGFTFMYVLSFAYKLLCGTLIYLIRGISPSLFFAFYFIFVVMILNTIFCIYCIWVFPGNYNWFNVLLAIIFTFTTLGFSSIVIKGASLIKNN